VKIRPEIKILAVSAYDSNEVADEALKYGAMDYVHKDPGNLAVLGVKIKQILKV
jgi:DNA-binding NarL/FixJ family response regulator